MPAAPYALVRVSLNGGAIQTGGITAAGTETCQLSADPAGLNGATQVLWEILDRPAALALPSGWTLASDGFTYRYLGATPPPFTLLSVANFGKYIFRLTLNGGGPALTGRETAAQVEAIAALTDVRTAISVESVDGLIDLGYYEKTQFSFRGWVADMKANLRKLQQLITSAGGGAGTSNHSLLSNLTADDHPHYELARRPLQDYTAASNDLALADARKCVTSTRATAISLRIRTQANIAWLSESLLGGINVGAGTLTLTAEAGVTLNGSVTVPQNGWWWAKRTNTNVWQCFTGGTGGTGDLKADGSVAMTADLNLGGNQATNAGDAAAATDLTTLQQVNALIAALARRPIQSYTGASNDLAATDSAKFITASHGSALSLRIRLQSAVTWLSDTELVGANVGAGTLTITAEAGVTLNGSVTIAPNGWFFAKRTASNTWQVFVGGAGSTITAGDGLTNTAGTFSVDAADATLVVGAAGVKRAPITGDVTIGDGSNAATIANNACTTAKIADDAVTYQKCQNVSAASRLLGRGSAAGAGDIEELACTGGLSISGTNLTIADSALAWSKLAPAIGNLGFAGLMSLSYTGEVATTGATPTVNFTTGDLQKTTLNANCTPTFTAPAGVGAVVWHVKQDPTGGRSITFPGSVLGFPPQPNQAANADTFYPLFWDGTNYYCLAGSDDSDQPTQGADLTDANVTITPAGGGEYRLRAGVTTTTRSTTCGTTGSPEIGEQMILHVYAQGSNHNVINGGPLGNTIYTVVAGTLRTVIVEWDGANWVKAGLRRLAA